MFGDLRRCFFLAAAIGICGVTGAEPLRIGFLVSAASWDAVGHHDRGAWETARALGDSTLLYMAEGGGFADAAGAARDLAEFDVVWHHQGDAIAYTALHRPPYITAIRGFAERGGGVLLTGGALAMVDHLGLEPYVRSQRRDIENWRDPAAMAAVERSHPVFSGLEEDGDGLIWLSEGGCRALADFYWGGPSEGMVLGNTPRGVERPLVEYSVGSGRMVLFGWLWPDYADFENTHRRNLLRLTSNLLAYLSDPAVWHPVIIRSDFPEGRARWRSLRLAVEDLTSEFGQQYPRGGEFLRRLDELEAEQDEPGAAAKFEALRREALLANPLLDFDRLLLIRRGADKLGLPMNYHGNDDIEPDGYENALVAIDMSDSAGELESVFTPDGGRFIGDMDLHYDAGRLLLSTPDDGGLWHVAELDLASGGLKLIPLIDEPDVHNYDACYLPDGRIVFTSTAPFIGVPCLGGRSKVANLYLLDHCGSIRRLTNDQDHNWCPTVLNDGRLLYQRWEYADIAHAFTRLLFRCNPDGSGQMEYYGSNSFWPTAMFYARPVPNHPTKVVAVVGGHHDPPRQGELVVFDPALGRHEASGVVQRIPGYGQPVEPVILDGLTAASWPRFLHPYPLSEKYFIVSCKPSHGALWGVYLVDVFDNFVLLREEPGWAMFEPTPWRTTDRQPVMADVADWSKTEATVLMVDVYRGPGLAGVPRGSVKSLRLIGYGYTFHGMGAEPDRVGLDGPWDVKRILGTVPVEPDGSAAFVVPAVTPIAVQPLDADGKALQLMRSWFTAVPGEVLSCVGCHEKQNQAPPVDVLPTAFRRAPSEITPWYGPARGFSFEREVQPVLDAYCTGCHHGGEIEGGAVTFDLRAKPAERVPSAFQMHFSPSYMQLRRWVHSPTLESDAHMLPPRDYHADTSRLVQILRDGHYGTELSSEAWDRLITWIDLNAPFHGAWKEVVASDPVKLDAALHGAQRRRELHRLYAGIDEDPEVIYDAAALDPAPVPVFEPLRFEEGSPPPAYELDDGAVVRIEIAANVWLELVRIEPGQFKMGSDRGYPNERPARLMRIDQPFLMGRFEITNSQYRCFAPGHDSGLETGEAYQFGDDERGHTLDRPEQPAVRVSWTDARAFCGWLSAATGRKFSLPTEAQWEYACRAGTMGAMWYGGLNTDFSGYANLSDATHHTVYYAHVPTALPPWRPADTRFDDGWRVSARVGSFAANPWGLYDMHGNVAEWTISDYDNSGRRKVVRGGSWLDCPNRAGSAFRLHYDKTQIVKDVGFRVVAEAW